MNFSAVFSVIIMMVIQIKIAFEVAILKNRGLCPQRKSTRQSIREHNIEHSAFSCMTLFPEQENLLSTPSLQMKASKRQEILHLLRVIAMERISQHKGRVNGFQLSSSLKSQVDLGSCMLQTKDVDLSSIQQLDIVDVDHAPIQCVDKPEISALLSGWLEVKPAGLKGRGLFALCCIEENTFLGEYVGEKLTYRQYLSRYPKGDSEYTFLVSEEAQRRDRTYIDAVDESKSNLLRFVNHNSVNPNVKVEVIFFGPKDRGLKENGSNDGDQEDEGSRYRNRIRAGFPITGVEPYINQTRKDKKSVESDRIQKSVHKRGSNFEIRMTSLTSIPAGSELFFDYGLSYKPAVSWDSE